MAQIDESRISKNAKEVQNYDRDLKMGFYLIKKDKLLFNRHILQIQKILEGNNAGFRTQSGTILKNALTGDIKHIPPQHKDDIVRLMDNLECYINKDLDTFDPLLRLAIIHYQFEAIHPFHDGNGRSGRILNVLYLVYKRLLDLPILYLSTYIIKYKQDYHRLLSQVSNNGVWNEWICYILQGIDQTSSATIQRIKDIDIAIKYSKDLVEILFSHLSIGESMDKALRVMGFSDKERGRKQTLHSFRGTFRSLCDTYQKEHNATFEVKEAVLDHRIGNSMVAAYLHKADYFEEMKALLCWWADFLDRLKTSS